MCMSTVYRDTVSADNILLKNVRAFRVSEENVILTTILEQELTVKGTLLSADLINGIVIIDCK